MAARRALIITQPPGHNYGGLLQAWALQKVVEGFGWEVVTDSSRPARISKVLRRVVKHGVSFLKGEPHRPVALENQIDRELLGFVRKRLNTVALHRGFIPPSKRMVAGYGVIITGSDQVWRPAYAVLSTTMLAFSGRDPSVPRISYAASFGVGNEEEFGRLLRLRTRRYAQRLDAISVREESGVGIVSRLWGVDDAHWHVDPTMLLSAADYAELLSDGGTTAERCSTGQIAAYVLDASAATDNVVDAVSRRTGHTVLRIPGSVHLNAWEFEKNPAAMIRPSVEQWLSSIHNSEFVVTDSFHGCVFSILFRRPFVAIVNGERGAARFESLLGRFGLESRAVDRMASASEVQAVVAGEIDWDAVETRLAAAREDAFAYLRRFLSTSDGATHVPVEKVAAC